MGKYYESNEFIENDLAEFRKLYDELFDIFGQLGTIGIKSKDAVVFRLADDGLDKLCKMYTVGNWQIGERLRDRNKLLGKLVSRL